MPFDVTTYVGQCEGSGVDPIFIVDYQYNDAIELIASLSASGESHVNNAISMGRIPVAIVTNGGITWAAIPSPK